MNNVTMSEWLLAIEPETLTQACLCGSGQAYEKCCHPYHTQQAFPATAEKLMRSRFVAYAWHLKPYLLATWCDATRPGELEFEESITWQRLRIHKSIKGQAKMVEGWVSFSAHYQVGTEVGVMHEKSYFKRNAQGNWSYVNGDVR